MQGNTNHSDHSKYIYSNYTQGMMAYRPLGLQTSFGDHVHFALLDDVMELVTCICEGSDLDLPTSSIHQVKAEDLPFTAGIGVPPDGALD